MHVQLGSEREKVSIFTRKVNNLHEVNNRTNRISYAVIWYILLVWMSVFGNCRTP